jgi:drug/metabolite transporter (DMT)-like permease
MGDSASPIVEPLLAPAAGPVRAAEVRASLMLVGATVCWGLLFPLTKDWQDAARTCPGGELVATLTILTLRMSLALVVLGVFRPQLFLKPSRRALGIGALLGAVNGLGNILQVLGLAWTTPARSGFFTSLACAWVPFLALACFRVPVARATWVGLALGVAGVVLLGFQPEGGAGLNGGDGVTLLASLVFAAVVVLLDRLGRKVESSHLTVGFIGMQGLPPLLLAVAWSAGGAGVETWLSWLGALLSRPAVLLDVGLLTVLCTVLPFLWMTTYQPRVPVGRAALIYLLEPVFASAFSLLWGYDSLTLRLVLGGGLILGGNLLVEMPVWLRGPRNAAGK